MVLESGSRLGPYEITVPIGAGGMGQVYRARDTNLGRDVAIKVLPDLFAEDPERLARFQREAQVLASLNHPNIASIYGLEEVEGVRALVLELVEGPTLAERIAQGPIPLDEVLPIAKQIAEGLEAAHEKNIIHRDLKPANVKLREDGTVKVLDFGLAKALEGDEGSDPSESPTMTAAATRAGVIMGTAAYMSPEQARGKTVDRRADIWAFGVVLWEMLTGRRLFAGETVTDTLAAVIREELDWNKLPSDTPAPIREILRRSLTRDLKRRFQAIGEARIAIEEHLDNPVDLSQVAIARAPAPAWLRVSPWIAIIMAAAFLASLWALWRPEEPAEQTPVRLRMEMPAEASLVGFEPAFSPDGKLLAYATGTGSKRAIYLRAMNQLETKQVPGTERPSSLFFSPDGQWIAFHENYNLKLKKVSVNGSTLITLCDALPIAGGVWGVDDTIVFGQRTGGLMRLPAAGGAPEELTRLLPNEETHGWPHFLPGGSALLFASIPRGSSISGANIEVLDLGSGEREVVHRGGIAPSYLPTGHMAYFAEGTLFVVPFDLDRLEISGTPVPVLQSISFNQYSKMNPFTYSASGTLLYLPGGSNSLMLMPAWVDRRGNTNPLPNIRAADFWKPAISPESTHIALQRNGEERSDIWVYELARGSFSRLTFEARNYWPVWTPDSRFITFGSYRSGNSQLFRKRADGSGDAEELTQDLGRIVWPNAWLQNGNTLTFSAESGDTLEDLWMLRMDEKDKPGSPEPFLETRFNERDAAFSPDGHWIAYMSNESRRWEVYVRPFPKGDGKWQVSTGGGWLPIWARNTQELFYRNGEKMMAVTYSSTDNTFLTEPPRELFVVPTMDDVNHATFDVTRDGQRFIVLLPQEDPSAPTTGHAILVLNWFDEIKRLVPTPN